MDTERFSETKERVLMVRGFVSRTALLLTVIIPTANVGYLDIVEPGEAQEQSDGR